MPGKPKGLPKTGGRQKGTCNKQTIALKEMILAALDAVGGKRYLMQQSRENSAAFLVLVGKVLPLTVAGDKDNPIKTDTTIEIVHVKSC